MKHKREILSILLVLVLFFLVFQSIGKLLIPELDVTGTDWKSYQKEPENSIQVFFVGSSTVFCDVSPAVVYDRSGVTSYDIAGPQQNMPISYYYIREACKTQKPEAIMLELKGLFLPQYTKYTIANYVYMPFSLNKLEAIFKTARQEDVMGLLFPLLNYHDRWNDLTLAELKQRLQPVSTAVNAGFMGRSVTEEQTGITYDAVTDAFMETGVQYLREIADFCREQDIALYLYLSPSTSVLDPDTKAAVEAAVQDLNLAGYYDFSTEEAFQEIGLDMKTDWSDSLHLNKDGAEKFSACLGELLLQNGIQPSVDADASLWQYRVADFYGD